MYEKVSIPEIFGMNVFNDSMMRDHLPKHVYEELKKTIERGEMLNSSIADIIANAMKDWAIERGATHYPHWFQPMTTGRNQVTANYVLLHTFQPVHLSVDGSLVQYLRRFMEGSSRHEA